MRLIERLVGWPLGVMLAGCGFVLFAGGLLIALAGLALARLASLFLPRPRREGDVDVR